MGTTANYVMVAEEELQQLLTGDAQKFVDDLCNERWGLSPRFAPAQDTFEKEVAANPLELLNYEKYKAFIDQAFANYHEQQALSQQRIRSGDREEQFDEICKLYAFGERRWERCDNEDQTFRAFKEFGGFTEDELALEAIKRGYHLQTLNMHLPLHRQVDKGSSNCV